MNGSAGLQEMKANKRDDAEASAFLNDIRCRVADASTKLLKVLEDRK